MKIIADKDIPYVQEAFSKLGNLTLLPSHQILPGHISGAEALIIRAATPVTRELIEQANLSFIGTTSVGEDHIDKSILKEKNIRFSSASGCSAQSVAEFVLLLWNHFNQKNGGSFNNSVLGIVGAGNIGSALHKLAALLGIPTLVNDPPLAEKTSLKNLVSLNTILKEADVISLHVPLIAGGKHPTHHLLNKANIYKIKQGAILINTSRGEVIDEQAVLSNLKRLSGLILDVFAHEPEINRAILQQAHIATPHIAGYTKEAKIKATSMIHKAICDCYHLKPCWKTESLIKEKKQLDLGLKKQLSLPEVFGLIHDINQDQQNLLESQAGNNKAALFRKLRSSYPLRNEFKNHLIKLSSRNKILINHLVNLGFTVKLC